MNRPKLVFTFFAVLLAIPLIAVAARPAQNAEVHEIKMTAEKYSFDPAVITVKQGERVRLIITALDREHGFELKAYSINERLKEGVPTTVEFTASKPGRFKFSCSVFCGMGHRHMRGELVVNPE